MTELHNKKRLLKSTQFLGMICLLVTLLTGCGSSTSSGGNSGGGSDPVVPVKENATTGEITIGVDETLRPIGRQMANAFTNLHPEAIIHLDYQPENILFERLLQDSVRLILAGRDLTETEKYKISQEQIIPKTTALGTDALVVVMHPDNPHDSLSRDQLERMLSGKLKNWQEMDSSQNGELVLVFDQAQTGTLRFLKTQILPEGDTILGKAYAAKGHEDLVDYVATNTSALGFIGASWITDTDQPLVKEFLEKVKLVRLEAPDTSDIPGQFIRPYQAELALNRYPLCRPFYAHSREHFSGLGTGFVVFASGEQGQRIVLKSGLNPENPPPRYLIFPEQDNETEE